MRTATKRWELLTVHIAHSSARSYRMLIAFSRVERCVVELAGFHIWFRHLQISNINHTKTRGWKEASWLPCRGEHMRRRTEQNSQYRCSLDDVSRDPPPACYS